MTQPSNAAKNQLNHPRRSGAGFGLLLSLLIATAAAITSYWTWQQSNIRDEVQSELEIGLSQLLGAIEKQRKEVNRHFKTEQQQRQNFNTLQQRLIELESKFTQPKQPIKADRWSHAEALYLINIAEYRYHMEQNSSMAGIALERAREQLLEHGYSTTSAVIKALSQLIIQLKSDGTESRARQITELEALSALIPELPATKKVSSRSAVRNSGSVGDYSLESIDGWRHFVGSLRQDVQQLFRISRPDSPDSQIGPPITADIYPLLRQQLALKIDFARLALLSNSPRYIATTKEILQLLRSHFDLDSTVIKEQIELLERMITSGEQRLPDLNFETLRQHLLAGGGQ